MRVTPLFLLALFYIGCAHRNLVDAENQVAPPPQTTIVQKPAVNAAIYPTPETVQYVEQTQFERNNQRCAEIENASLGEVELRVSRATSLRDSTGLMAVTILPLDEGNTVEALSHEGLYWGVRTVAGTCGYVAESALDWGERDIVMVRQGTSALISRPVSYSGSVSSPTESQSQSRSISCDDFSSRTTAQEAFAADPFRLSHLDRDDDGLACEVEPPAPPQRVSSSPPRQTTQSTSRRYIRGPRGGCYYYNSNGNKTYVSRNLCG